MQGQSHLNSKRRLRHGAAAQSIGDAGHSSRIADAYLELIEALFQVDADNSGGINA
ncbi:MAG: hypothetical protein AB1762_20405 [Gemmatimonadota bacterium]